MSSKEVRTLLHKLRKIVVAVGTAAMLFGTMGAIGASASTTATVLTRAQFVYDFAVANNLAPVYPTTPTFSDVPASSPYYGYIEAAYQAGWIIGVGNGDFAPNSPLTRAQVVKIEVIALGDGPAALADASSSTTFTDNSSIPSWARGYVVEAVKLGLVKGYPNGSFAPNQSLTTSDEPFFLSQYKAVATTSAFTISASPSDAGVGQAVTLSAKGASGTVTYSVTSSNAAINGSTFIASAAGNYTVTGTAAGGVTATTVVNVYGAATGLKINAPATIVANGATANTVTVDVVDANGNIVANSSDSITLTSSDASVLANPSTNPVSASSGVATFSLTSGTVVSGKTTLTATDTTASPNLSQTATVSSVGQTATSISLSPAQKYVENNDGSGSDLFTATVNDQTGNAMSAGTFQINFTLTGPSGITFANGTTSYTAAYYNGTNATVTVDVAKAAAGSFTVTASTPTTGISSGTASADAVTVGAATALQLSQSGTTATADQAYASTNTSTGNLETLTITAVDSHGFPTAWTGTADVTEMLGTSPGALQVNGTTPSTTTGVVPVSVATTTANPSVTVNVSKALTQSSNTSGTYTFQASDAASVLTSSSTLSFSVTPGTAKAVVISPSTSINLGDNSPVAVVTAQITDAEGNNVSMAGVGLTFTLNAISPTPAAEASLSATSVSTGASGSASTTLTLEPYNGNKYTVTVAGASGSGLSGTSTTGTFELFSTVPQSLSATLLDSCTSSGQTIAGTPVTCSTSNAAHGVTLTVYGYDQYNSQVGSDSLTITPSAGLNISGAVATGGTYSASTNTFTAPLSGGKLTVTGITATTAGTQSVSIVDNNSEAAITSNASISVVAGAFSAFDVMTAINGSNLSGNSSNSYLAFTTNKAATVWLQPSDASGNLAPPTATEEVYLTSDAASFSFANSNGTPLPSITYGATPKVYYELSVPAGSSAIAVQYTETATGTNSPYDNLTATYGTHP